jgi:stearoyl-CoA desaturase (delta-9 desaturase)
MDKRYHCFVAAGILVPGLIGYVFEPSLIVAAQSAAIAGFGRIAVIQHITWGVNSFGHRFGRKDNDSKDQSRNNLILGVLALGDGFHHDHHQEPRRLNLGSRWYEVDLTYVALVALQYLGLAQLQPSQAAPEVDVVKTVNRNIKVTLWRRIRQDKNNLS